MLCLPCTHLTASSDDHSWYCAWCSETISNDELAINESRSKGRAARLSLLKSLLSFLSEVHVQGCDAVIQGQPPLDVPVLGEGIDGGIWSVMTQQCWHVTLHSTYMTSHNFAEHTTAWQMPVVCSGHTAGTQFDLSMSWCAHLLNQLIK